MGKVKVHDPDPTLGNPHSCVMSNKQKTVTFLSASTSWLLDKINPIWSLIHKWFFSSSNWWGFIIIVVFFHIIIIVVFFHIIIIVVLVLFRAICAKKMCFFVLFVLKNVFFGGQWSRTDLQYNSSSHQTGLPFAKVGANFYAFCKYAIY